MDEMEPCGIEYTCQTCGQVCQLLNNEPGVCYECPNCRSAFHTEIDEESGELIVVVGCE